MPRKYVKIFEELNQPGDKPSYLRAMSNMADSEPDFVPPEGDEEAVEYEDLPRINLRGGQKAALTRGDDILSDGQYAACYLNAIQALGRSEDTRGRGDTGLTRNALKMVGKEEEDWQKISAAKLSVYLNLKPQTVERTVSKFKLLLQGEREGTESNVIWPELANLFDRFESMPKAEVLGLAEEAIDKDADDSVYRAYLDKMNAKSKESTEKKRSSENEIYDKLMRLFNSLKQQVDPYKAAAMSLSKIAKENEGYDVERLRILAQDKLRRDPIIMKYFKK